MGGIGCLWLGLRVWMRKGVFPCGVELSPVPGVGPAVHGPPVRGVA